MIHLAPYDPAWPAQFLQEKQRLTEALHDIVVDIVHVGSTAIPGMVAKPILDIQVGISSLALLTSHHIQQLGVLEYDYIKEYEQILPFRRFFQKRNALGEPTHQIHLVTQSSSWWQRHILFRDYLRCYRDAATEYAAHKRQLAPQYDDTLLYAKAKTEFIATMNKRAFFDVKINRPFIQSARCDGYIPQLCCIPEYQTMLQDKTFIACYGIAFDEATIAARVQNDMAQWDSEGFGTWMWYERDTHRYIGRGGVRTMLLEDRTQIELAYAIRPEYWGKGIAKEISEVTIQFARHTLQLAEIICFTLTNNRQSLRVMEKLGFSYIKDFTYRELGHKLYTLDLRQPPNRTSW